MSFCNRPSLQYNPDCLTKRATILTYNPPDTRENMTKYINVKELTDFIAMLEVLEQSFLDKVVLPGLYADKVAMVQGASMQIIECDTLFRHINNTMARAIGSMASACTCAQLALPVAPAADRRL